MKLISLNRAAELAKIRLDPEVFYFWFPYGLGDLYIVTLLKDKIEEHLGGKIVFIVKDKQRIVIDQYNVDYISLLDNYSANPIMLNGISSSFPQKGHIYSAHPLCNDKDFVKQLDFLDGISWYKKYFKIEDDYQIDPKNYLRQITCQEQTKSKVFSKCNVQVEDVVLFIPDALSTNNNCISYMNFLIMDRYRNNVVLYNSIKNLNLDSRAIKIDLSLAELVEVCFNCKAVVSNRNGLCDVIQEIGDKLTIFYDKSTYHSWAISKMFNNSKVNEIVI